jgi:hypothetical protein
MDLWKGRLFQWRLKEEPPAHHDERRDDQDLQYHQRALDGAPAPHAEAVDERQ